MFRPFHTFQDCKAFEIQIARLKNVGGAIPPGIAEAHDLYHYSLLHKLRSAKYHAENLASYLQSQDSSKTPAHEIIYRVNFHLDGFLQTMGSSADIFAREVLTYYGITLPTKVYFHSAEDMIRTARPTEPILAALATPSWRGEFSNYRNTATHESLILTGFTVNVEVRGQQQVHRLQFGLPDDPRANPRTFHKYPDVVEYCGLTFRRWLRIFNKAYGEMARTARAKGSLPL